MSDVIGFVKSISSKQGVGKNGKPYTIYNVVLVKKDDNSELRVGWGFDAPGFNEGQWIKADVVQNGQYFNYNKGSPVKVQDGPAPKVTTSAPVASGGGGGGGYNDPARQASIIYQSSRKDAIEFVKILAQADALPISAAKSKSAEAKRFDQLKDIVDKLTVQFVRDVETLRLMESVEDAGSVVAAEEQPLPASAAPEPEEEEEEMFA